MPPGDPPVGGFFGGGSVTVPLPLLEEPLPLFEVLLPLLDELLPELDEPLFEVDEPLLLLEEPVPLLEEPLLEFEEPLPELDGLLPLLDEPKPLPDELEPLFDDPLPEVDEPLLLLEELLPELDEPLPEFDDPEPDPDELFPLLDEPLPELDGALFPPVFAADGGSPFSSVSVSSHKMPGSMEIESVREPALITSDFTEPVANVALEPSTVASIDVPPLISETVMELLWSSIPLQVKTPLAKVGVTLSIRRFSSASKPWKCAEGLTNLLAR